jgi:hypothetical protein
MNAAMNSAMNTMFADRPLWQQTSVQQFLSDVNWEGLAQKPKSKRDLAAPPDSSRVDPNAPLPMTLSVSQFLTSVNWDGATLVAVPMNGMPAMMEMNAGIDKASEFTSNDFSDLF